jgi:hypothetical protein
LFSFSVSWPSTEIIKDEARAEQQPTFRLALVCFKFEVVFTFKKEERQ